MLDVHVGLLLQDQEHESGDLLSPCSSRRTCTKVDLVCVCVTAHEGFDLDHLAVEEQKLLLHLAVVTCIGLVLLQLCSPPRQLFGLLASLEHAAFRPSLSHT